MMNSRSCPTHRTSARGSALIAALAIVALAAVVAAAVLVYRVTVDGHAFSTAEHDGSVAAWESYVRDGGKRAAEVQRNQLPEAAYREALDRDNSSGWQLFVERFPASPRVQHIRAESMPAAICREARQDGSLDALRRGITAAGEHPCRDDLRVALVQAQCRNGMDVAGLLEMLRGGHPEHATALCREALYKRARAARDRIACKAAHPEIASVMLAAMDVHQPGKPAASSPTKVPLRISRTLSLGSMAHRFGDERIARIERGILEEVQKSIDSVTEPGFVQVVLGTDGGTQPALIAHYALHPDAGRYWARYCRNYKIVNFLGSEDPELALMAATVRMSLERAHQTTWESGQVRVAMDGTERGSCEDWESTTLPESIGYEVAKRLWK